MSTDSDLATVPYREPQAERRALRVYHVYRIVVASLLLLLQVANTESSLVESLTNPQHMLQVNQIYGGLVLLGYGLLYMPGISLALQIHSALLIDLAALTLFMELTGGVVSGLNVLLVPTIAAAGVLLPMRIALLYSALGFFALIVALVTKSDPITMSEVTRSGILGSVFFVAVAVTHLLAERARRNERLAARRSVEVAELADLNETIVQRMQTGLIAVDKDLQIRLMNNAARRVLDYEGEFETAPLESVSPPLARHLRARFELPNRPGGPAEELPEIPGALLAYMRVGEAENQDTVVFIERQSDAEARLQQIKLAAVGRLTAGIAHEIRNPLAAVTNAAQLLEESQRIAASERRIAEIIRNNAKRMNRIVENILQVSRREQARPRILRLKPFLDTFTEEFQSTRPEPFASLTAQVDPPDLELYFDPGHLHQVLWNLCQNACRHGAREPGGAHIQVATGMSRRRDRRPFLEVSDDGPGVPEDQAQKLFEPFFTTSTRGTGLGLYLSRELCDFNRAALTYQQRPEGGSCFRITFSSKDVQDQPWPIELH